ncbi:MAG TPA: hypothetical protein VFP44_17215 [Usitatibacter sp.]|nr:hypothetical protein [Usitatibacter sp.]
MTQATRWILGIGCCLLFPCMLAANAAWAQGSLSEGAKRELARATAAVEDARRHGALWTTAELALQSAQKAAKDADNASVIKHSTTAMELSKLGVAQTRYPLQH